MLILFYFAACPFCQKVLSFCEEQQIYLEKKDISIDLSARDELLRLGGKKQVPALQVDGEILYESDAIIAYLSDRKQ